MVGSVGWGNLISLQHASRSSPVDNCTVATAITDPVEEEIVTDTVSDEALEAAAGPQRAWNFSLLFPPTAAFCC